MTLNQEQKNILNQIFEELKKSEGHKNEIEDDMLCEYINKYESNLRNSEDDEDVVDGIDISAFSLVDDVLAGYREYLELNNLIFNVKHGPEYEIRAPYDRDILISHDYCLIEFYSKCSDESEEDDDEEVVYAINLNIDIRELKKDWIEDYLFISEEITSVFFEVDMMWKELKYAK